MVAISSLGCSTKFAKPSQVDELLPQHTPIKSNAAPLYTSQQMFNPPEVQKLIVEHVVRSGQVTAQGPVQSRLRVFSGKCPRPGNEVDYGAPMLSLY